MKKLENYKIAPQAKFVKFKVKHFVEIPTIRHDKAVPPPLLDCLKSSPPLNVSPPWLLKISSCPPPSCLADDTKIIPPLIPGGRTLCSEECSKSEHLNGGLPVLSAPSAVFRKKLSKGLGMEHVL